jgi:threonine dehydratase
MKSLVEKILLSRVYEVAKETPLEKAEKLSSLIGNSIYLKREDLQPVHSFKLRGAYNKIANLTPTEVKNGVIAASAGNHAQGVALSAQKLGIKATLVMPATTPDIKVSAVKTFGAKVILWGDNYSEAQEYCQGIVKKSKMAFIHPFDDIDVIAGQGTIGREIIEQLPDATHIFLPIGGGGLIAGVAALVKQLKPRVKIIGVEPDDSNAMQQSIKAKSQISLPHVGIFADGVAVKKVGDLTFKLVRHYVDEIITVSADEICAAIKDVFEETRSILEPAGALSVAGAKSYSKTKNLTNQHLVAVCSGANLNFERLQFIAERTMLGSGKEAIFSVELGEQPGTLAKFCQEVVNGHSITEFNYRLNDRKKARIFVGINTKNNEDKRTFVDKMKSYGYKHVDLSGDELAKDHVRHMIGGPSTSAENEHLYHIDLPERPGALSELLNNLGDRWNISLFHYRNLGGDIGRILIGFEVSDTTELEALLKKFGHAFEQAYSQATRLFL